MPNVSYCEDNNEVHYNPLPYQGFCKLTLNDGSTVELEGSGELTSAMIDGYESTVINAEIGELCTSIGDNAFQGCTGLTSVTIGNSVTSIGAYAFYFCGSLTSITIPNSVTSIGAYAFYFCGSLTSITIPNSVTSIGVEAFYECTSLTSVTIGDGVTSIGARTFCQCNSLTTVTIGDGVTSIGESAFADCTSLISVIIGSGVTSIGPNAFGRCSSLTSVTIPNSVTSIGDGAFNNCSGLTSVTIPNNVTSISYGAFNNCSGLESITSLATTAPTIQVNTFQGVKTDGTLTVPSGSSGYDNWMSSSAYYLGYYNWTKVEAKLVVYYDIQDISAPTTIFTNYDSSVKSIDIDGKETLSGFSQGDVTYQFNSVGEHVIKYEFNNPTTVGNNAPLLNNLTTVKRVVIPNTFTAIGQYAFHSCSGLTSVVIGSGVTSIGRQAFYNCSGLTTITSYIMNAPSVNGGTFQGVKNGGTLYVPIGSSGYDVWMNDQGNLGYHNWTKVEQ